jgi:hypothetical protein
MKYLIATLLLILQVNISEAKTLKINTFGCLIKEDLIKIFKMEDGATLLYNLIQTGYCREFKADEKIMVEVDEGEYRACIIPIKGTQCFWILGNMLKS